MNCASCDTPLADIDEYIAHCFVCKKTFAKLTCKACASKLFEIIGRNDFVCANKECPTSKPQHFQLPPSLAHLVDRYLPYAPPPKEPRSSPLEGAQYGPFIAHVLWARKNCELDIVIELPSAIKYSSGVSWEWNEKEKTLTIYGSKEHAEARAKIPLREKIEGLNVRNVHAKKTPYAWYLVVTIQLEAEKEGGRGEEPDEKPSD